MLEQRFCEACAKDHRQTCDHTQREHQPEVADARGTCLGARCRKAGTPESALAVLCLPKRARD